MLLIIYVRFLENRTLFIPAKNIEMTPSDIGLSYDDVYFPSGEGIKLNGWFIPALKPRATIIFSHGNAGNIGDRLGKIKMFHDLNLNVFIYDYRGYGNSEGKPSEEGMYQDILAAYQYLVSEKGAENIIAYGASLGGAAAIDLASKKEVSGVIIDSSFSNAADMAKRIFPLIPSAFIRVKLDSLTKIKSIHAPILFLHSPEDTTVPYDLGRKLFEAANEPKTFIDLTGGHNDGHVHAFDEFAQGINTFIKGL